MYKNKPRYEENKHNFAIVLRATPTVFEKIRMFAVNHGATVIYQTCSSKKLWITKEAAEQSAPLEEYIQPIYR